MKVFSAGQLLSEKTSPFGKAMTEIQCLQYALDKPGVLTVLPGIMNKAERRSGRKRYTVRLSFPDLHNDRLPGYRQLLPDRNTC